MGTLSDISGERKHVRGWVSTALERTVPKSVIYPQKGRCACAKLFYEYAPAAIRN